MRGRSPTPEQPSGLPSWEGSVRQPAHRRPLCCVRLATAILLSARRARSGGRRDRELLGQPRAQLQEFAAPGSDVPQRGREVIDAASLPASEAVPGAVLVEVQAGGAVLVQSVGHGVAYVTEVERRFDHGVDLFRTGYP